MTTKSNNGWRKALMLCAAAAVAVLVSSCRAPASDAGRYQWNIVPGNESRQDQICVSDTVTGEVAVWNGSAWSPSYMAPLSTPDWNDIRKQREWEKKRAEREKKLQEETREKREALVKTYSQMPLEKQVAWAKKISIIKFRGRRVGQAQFELFEFLKHERGLDANDWRQPYKAQDDGIVVQFEGMVDDMTFQFGLSHTPIDSKWIFLAPETIIDDVKAEIKRQEEQQKASHAENH